MKKLLTVSILTFVCLLFPVAVLAEGNLPTDPFTWGQLATILGATTAVVLIVQAFKFPLDKVWKIPTRVLVYFISLIILLLATYFTEGLTVQSALLTALNAVIVMLAAWGAYEVTFRNVDEKRKQETTIDE